jgi:hypothetical protein
VQILEQAGLQGIFRQNTVSASTPSRNTGYKQKSSPICTASLRQLPYIPFSLFEQVQAVVEVQFRKGKALYQGLYQHKKGG